MGEAAEGELKVVEHNRHKQSTSQRAEGTSDVGPSLRCLRSRVDGLFTGDVERGSKQAHDSCKSPGDMVPKPQSLDRTFLDLESRAPSVFAGGAFEAAEQPPGVERGYRLTGGTGRPEALLF